MDNVVNSFLDLANHYDVHILSAPPGFEFAQKLIMATNNSDVARGTNVRAS